MKRHDAKDFSLVTGVLEASARATSNRDFRLDIRLPFFRNWTPGQFVMIRWGRHLVGRPFAIVDWQQGEATQESVLSVWVRRLGAGTEELFAWAHEGAPVQVTVPLGRGLEAQLLSAPRLLLVSGGVGAASLWPLAQARARQGLLSDVWVHGEREAESFDRELASHSVRPSDVCFESRAESGASQGRVTDLIAQRSAEELKSFSAAVVCGPTVMLAAVAQQLEGLLAHQPIYLGLEERMACGVGLCFSCSVKCDSGMKRLCTEGPWFSSRDLTQHFAFRAGGRSL